MFIVLFISTTYSFHVNPTCKKAKLIVKANPVIVKRYGEIKGMYDFFSSWVSFNTNPGSGTFSFLIRGEKGWGIVNLVLLGSDDTEWLVYNFEIVHFGNNEVIGGQTVPMTIK